MDEKRDWRAFIDMIRAADEITAGKQRSEVALGMMFKVLEEYPLEAVSKAVSEHVRSNKFAVTPADIVRLISGSVEDRSAVAWRTLLTAIERQGYYDSVRFPDPAYHYAIQQLGGWERLCSDWHTLSDKEIHFRRQEWCRLYEVGMRVATWENEPGKVRVLPYLCGFYERDNREKGLERFIPAVLDVQTGEQLPREALTAGNGNIIQLPNLSTGTEARP